MTLTVPNVLLAKTLSRLSPMHLVKTRSFAVPEVESDDYVRQFVVSLADTVENVAGNFTLAKRGFKWGGHWSNIPTLEGIETLSAESGVIGLMVDTPKNTYLTVEVSRRESSLVVDISGAELPMIEAILETLDV